MWRELQLGEICEVLDYLRRPITKRDRVAGDYPYYGATGVVDYVADYLFDEKLVLVGEDGAKWESGARTAFVVEGKSWVNNHAHVLRPNRDVILDEWLAYFLEHLDVSPFVSGLTVPKLNQARLREIPIPLPQLSEQRQIVAMLDDALEQTSQVSAGAEQNLLRSGELFDRCVQQAFEKIDAESPRLRFGDLASDTLIGLVRSRSEQGLDRQYRYIKMHNITNDNRLDDEETTLVDATKEELSRFKLSAGDFLFNTRNSRELVGKSCVYQSATEEASLFNNNIMRVRFNDSVDPNFVLLSFSSKRVRDQLERMKSGTTNVWAIYASSLSELEISVPDRAKQMSMVKTLLGVQAACLQLSENMKAKRAASTELRRVLLHKAFSGGFSGMRAAA